MESESSLPHSQVPVTCPYPEPDQFISGLPVPFLEDPFKYYPPIYAWVSQAISFPQVSPPKPCIRLSSPHTITQYSGNFLASTGILRPQVEPCCVYLNARTVTQVSSVLPIAFPHSEKDVSTVPNLRPNTICSTIALSLMAV